MRFLINKKCVSCSMCELECPNKAIEYKNNTYIINQKMCNQCYKNNKPKCISVCPIKNAISIKYN